ncbi:transcription factor domain-containing protein [Aspergillus foveolatus]|uniref:transcription factor domain-containing protein n=1 Tax=Aspergillus foveolatus TaxID=210207 RepID=UPI003CCC987B
MSNSSFLDRPLLKVSRPVAACSRCRTAKIRCDGKLPACSACERAGKADTCSSSDEFPRGKERSYVGSLEAYCERLEKRAAELRERKRLLTGDEGGVVHESSITSASSVPATHAHSQEVSNIDDLVGDFGYLSVSATSRDFQGITSNTSFANLILAVSSGEQIPRSSPRPLPSRSEITPLIQHYFDTFYVQLPFFLETSFWASVDSVYQNGAHFAKPFDNWAVRMVLAIAYGSLSNSQLDVNHRNALSLVQEALQYTEDVLRPGTLAGIQAILFLAQYSLIDPVHFRTWYLVGMAARVLVDLGLHQDHHAEYVLSSEQQDLRRRVFHCVYSLDRATSTALDRTLSFSDDSVNVAFPSSKLEKTYIFSHSSEPAWNMVKIRRILSAAYQQKYFTTADRSFQSPASTWALYSQATEWFYNTPKNTSQVLAIRCHLEFLYTITVILAPSARHLPPCDYTKLLLFNRCIDYVYQLHQILESQIRLHVMDSIEIQRVYQTIRRLFNIVNQSFDVLMSPVPAAPQVLEDCPKPPPLELEDCLRCHERALECLKQAGNLLQYGARRWNHHALSQEFQKLSAPVRSILLAPAVTYAPTLGSYMPEEPAILPPADFLYGGLNLQHSSPENHNYD